MRTEPSLALATYTASGDRFVPDPLRLAESGDRPQDFPGDEIDDTEAVAAEFGNEEPFAFQIDREMVDPTAD